ncbi:MAG: YbaB/EbfC family nucleoid-associated protein [Lysobacteraceae bacterium]
MRGQLGNLMQQAQKMQENLKRAQEELAQLEVTGQAGAGMVKVTLNGKMAVRRVQIDKAAVGDDVEMLEDLIAAAFNDAVNKANEESGKRMQGVTAGLPIPPGMNLGGLF